MPPPADPTAGALAALDACFGGTTKLSLKGLGLPAALPAFLASQLPSIPKVDFVDLSLNPALASLPDEVGQMPAVATLFALGCGFEHVPPVIGQLSRLGMLSFKSNRLAEMDEGSIPPSVHWLILTDNRLITLPRSIGALTGLRKLMLSNNRISSLPAELCACTSLELIRLSDNQLSELPAGLLRLPKLAWVALAGNPCVTPAGGSAVVAGSRLEMPPEVRPNTQTHPPQLCPCKN